MSKIDIYIKPAKKVTIAGRRQVLIKDFVEVVAPKDVRIKVENLKVLDISSDKKDNYIISITDIIRVINAEYPNDLIINLGEMDTVVDYAPEKSKDNKFIKNLKVLFICVVLLAGSATAIMSFHTDSQMPTVFRAYYKMFFGKETDHPWIIDIPYSLGLAVGIVVFFNHFAGKKVTDDPTPIEVEMSSYETAVTDTMIDILNTERIREEGNEK